MSEPHVIVYPPDETGGRRVRVNGEILGRATSLTDLAEFLRRAGWEDEADWPAIEWRGGGSEAWSPEPPTS